MVRNAKEYGCVAASVAMAVCALGIALLPTGLRAFVAWCLVVAMLSKGIGLLLR